MTAAGDEKERGLQLATSFRRDEVEGLLSLMRALRENRDVRVMLRAEPLRSLEGKFVRMHAKAQTWPVAVPPPREEPAS